MSKTVHADEYVVFISIIIIYFFKMHLSVSGSLSHKHLKQNHQLLKNNFNAHREMKQTAGSFTEAKGLVCIKQLSVTQVSSSSSFLWCFDTDFEKRVSLLAVCSESGWLVVLVKLYKKESDPVFY